MTPPTRKEPNKKHKNYLLWLRVKEAIFALPSYFSAPDIRIVGMRATEVFTLGLVFGAAIEDQIVNTLNRIRHVWDPDDKYVTLRFERQPQTFPDVVLKDDRNGDIVFGIELKSWYLLAKEGEPSFRYQVTPSAATEWDLLVVCPWLLSEVISGTPKILSPFIESARFAAEYRNYWWQNIRQSKGKPGIISPEDVKPYPQKSDKILDVPEEDSGRNFGRIARIGIMDSYIVKVLDETIAGIPAQYWLKFLSMFREKSSTEYIESALSQLSKEIARSTSDKEGVDKAIKIINTILDIIEHR